MSALTLIPLIWAQASGTTGSSTVAGSSGGLSNPAALAGLALRRWFSGLTLCSPQAIPDLHGLWALVLGLLALLVLTICVQGPGLALRQILDVGGHVELVRRATIRVWKASRLVAAAITLMVLSWTGSQTLGFLGDRAERGRVDLTVLTRSRALGELAFDQGVLAALTPLRDLAGLADNLPLLVCAAYLVFRAAAGTLAPPESAANRPGPRKLKTEPPRMLWATSGWLTTIWCVAALYAVYRLVGRFSGSVDLPLGGCLVIESLLIPLMMLLCDGFLLAWVLVELRDATMDQVREDRFHPAPALELMPAASLACALALPARYVATLVLLTYQHLPTTVVSTGVGQYIRWQLGWGLIDLQAASLLFLGVAGITAWGRGSLMDALRGFGRLLRRQGGHLWVAISLAAAGSGVLAAISYPIILLLPPAGWVLPAADSYSHYLTLPIGLWTLAALIELARQSLPMATLDSGRGARTDAGLLPEADGASEELNVTAAFPGETEAAEPTQIS